MRCGEIAQTFIHIIFSKFTKHNLSLCNYCKRCLWTQVQRSFW